MDVKQLEEKKEKKMWSSSSSASDEMTRWLPPQMVLSVLLVEADDSTRHIISALLRKCSYRVAAVSDGLKAWETLKVKAQGIDLILTEVELPSISGYALLTLIMEHDICKNIPVIMMSAQDSISVVLKCMLKGAADFLIKPVGKNKLRNLWQYVWRRHTQIAGRIPQSTTDAQRKVDDSEKNTASSHSSELASTQVKRKSSEKGSDAQSSCTKPYLEAESVYLQNSQDISHMKHESISMMCHREWHEAYEVLFGEPIMPQNETKRFTIRSGPDIALFSEDYNATVFEERKGDLCDGIVTKHAGFWCENERKDDMTSEMDCHVNELVEPSSEAIDLIGRFENHPADVKCSRINDGEDKLIVAPLLDLSQKWPYSSFFKDEGSEQVTLNHSYASAFSRFDSSKAVQSLCPTSSNKYEKQEVAIASNNEMSNQPSENSSVTSLRYGTASGSSQDDKTKMLAFRCGKSEESSPGAQVGLIPIAGVGFEGFYPNYGHVVPPVFYTQSGFNPIWNSKSAFQKEQASLPMLPPSSSLCCGNALCSSDQVGDPSSEAVQHSADQTLQDVDNLESGGLFSHTSPAPDLSTSSNLCNIESSKLNSKGRNATADALDSFSGSVNYNQPLVYDGLKGMEFHRFTQRQGALLKFQMKRKDRCYEKKVRYQSRKRLAEQRPRVKGQFVRQVQMETTVDDTGDCT